MLVLRKNPPIAPMYKWNFSFVKMFLCTCANQFRKKMATNFSLEVRKNYKKICFSTKKFSPKMFALTRKNLP